MVLLDMISTTGLEKDTSQDESGVAAIKSVELDLDAKLGGRAVQYREIVNGEYEDEYDADTKTGTYYPEGWYMDEDGQLSWFNAGVRVGVGIGLGMCVGIGIGVGLLMRSYQATTSSFKRRFF